MKKQKPLDDIKAEILAEQDGTAEQDEHRANKELIGTASRRNFLKTVGISALLLGLGGQFYAMLRSLFPNVLYEPPQRFKVGIMEKFIDGGTFLEDKRLFIFRKESTFHAISASCTHLGCTVKMVKLNQPRKVTVAGRDINEDVEFHCPCHGSKYYGDGTNYEGPAPRGLDYFSLEVSPDDGQLIVDMSNRVDRDFRLTV
ncbi:MAG: ubiquinol-cytochrome c reductase iron-sulfur subunit [Acidobacteria bacterium]|nr:ubiquinol-cytochrome c reductase iron-sulfur subunit [Acidobacteriota bacterium]